MKAPDALLETMTVSAGPLSLKRPDTSKRIHIVIRLSKLIKCNTKSSPDVNHGLR